ncbi:hypothetical protein Ait01nite_068130 [Actinoplanes italicus]|uniref:Peptidoglycan/xylan/chitin deacetylase (PgdA/CDA1 family) n=1 Tax=Actinoplanes italicus TaxID=113567 RepID=A0A2T0K183_9ACTN|nr:polysaccharide deacetylase family protein [Actinoplanes italicus]PRX16561.1 peptidoglycan/xylan/chitin deacetylase (PgdA/CDA1 family) [Actinoplanes italicus]GIE33768.1 hypothetical protein Ait01nite_068130 [Actinoplanes italicus]
MKRTYLHGFVALAVLAGLTAAPTAARAGGRDCAGYVALTFDDGPTPGNTTALLDALRAARARATMFNTGQNVEANPALARAQVRAGMWIGNHSWDHPFMTQLTAEQQADQIARTQDVIRRATGVAPALFRPPYLDTNDALRAVERRYRLTEINTDADSKDWNNATVEEIVASARGMKAGDVILMHDWPPATVQAIPQVVAELRERGLCTGKISPVTGRAVAPGAPETRPLERAHTAGRVDDRAGAVRYTWPGVYFEGRFRGGSVGIVLDDAVNDYEIRVDDREPVNLVTPGRTTHWITGLGRGEHTVRVAKRTESPWAAGQFGGFVAGDGGLILGKPAARTRQIEFIGDSWTAGYGNMSTSRDCSAIGGVDRNSNADRTFGALTARGLGADYQLNAWSGRGMVRNYNGGDAGTDYRTWYDRTLQAVDTTALPRPASWKPQVIVIGLGINDFSTDLHAGEKWATIDELAADYRSAYEGFVGKLRERYGPAAHLILTYPTLWNTTAMADSIEQVVAGRNAAGDTRVRSLHYSSQLDQLGCDWHPSLDDHTLLAAELTTAIEALPLHW